MNHSEAAARVREVIELARGVVHGQDDAIEQTLITWLAGGHALLEGVPGTAKTLIARVVAHGLGSRFARVQFTPDLMPSDITGVGMPEDGGRFVFHPGPVFTDVLLADEINRAPAKTQAALLEAMQERQVTVDGVSRPLGDLFCVLATQNPVEHEGTYPLPEAQLDRFLLKIAVPYPDAAAELRMLDRHAEGFDAERLSEHLPPPVMNADAGRSLRALAATTTVAPPIREYISKIVRATREEPSITLGGSPRASVAILRAARAAALLAGRDFVVPDDVKRLATPVLRHRITLNAELEVEGRRPDDVLMALLSTIPAPQ